MSEKTNVRDIEKERFLAELRIKLEEAADDIKITEYTMHEKYLRN